MKSKKIGSKMKSKKIRQDEAGIAHLGLILLIVGVIGVIALVYARVNNSNKIRSANLQQAQTTESLPLNLESLKSLEEIELIAGVNDTTSIVNFALESKDGGYIYKLILSNGKKLVINAATGAVLSEEATDVSDDDKIPSGINITVSLADAYKIAAAKSSSRIKKIEMEVEDKKVVYKIEFVDGSKIEIDASGGAIIKSEIKSGSDDVEEDDEDEEEDDEDEDEEEDGENEDSDDSQDSEDHEEEDR